MCGQAHSAKGAGAELFAEMVAAHDILVLTMSAGAAVGRKVRSSV